MTFIASPDRMPPPQSQGGASVLEDPRITFAIQQTMAWSHVLHALFGELALTDPTLPGRALDRLTDLKDVLAPHGGDPHIDKAIETVSRMLPPKLSPITQPEPPTPPPAELPTKVTDHNGRVAMELMYAVVAELTMSDRAFVERVRSHLVFGCEAGWSDREAPIKAALQIVNDMLAVPSPDLATNAPSVD